jgi:hypothetical protein
VNARFFIRNRSASFRCPVAILSREDRPREHRYHLTRYARYDIHFHAGVQYHEPAHGGNLMSAFIRKNRLRTAAIIAARFFSLLPIPEYGLPPGTPTIRPAMPSWPNR